MTHNKRRHIPGLAQRTLSTPRSLRADPGQTDAASKSAITHCGTHSTPGGNKVATRHRLRLEYLRPMVSEGTPRRTQLLSRTSDATRRR